MLKRLRTLALMLAVIFTACVTNSLPDGADFRHAYFATVADYNQAKMVAVQYVARPETSDEQIDIIMDVITKADFELVFFEELRRAGSAKPSDFSKVTATLDVVTRLLRAYVAGSQI